MRDLSLTSESMNAPEQLFGPTLPSSIPPLPSESHQWRVSSAPGPWLHAGVASGTIDSASLGSGLAAFVGSSDPALVQKYQDFFQCVANFDISAYTVACKQLENELAAKHAFACIGLPTVQNIPEKIRSEVTEFAVRCFAVVKLADLLAWLAEPDNSAPLVVASPIPPKLDKLSKRDKELMADWCSAFASVVSRFRNKPTMYDQPSPAGSSSAASRGCKLLENAKSVPDAMAHLNLHSFVYSLKLYLENDPCMDANTILKILQQEQSETGDTYDLSEAVKRTNVAKLSAPLLYAFIYHPAAVLHHFRIVGLAPHPLLQLWRFRGNVHYADLQHPLVKMTRTFMASALRAAEDLPSTPLLPGALFNDPTVIDAVSIGGTTDARQALNNPVYFDGALNINTADVVDNSGSSEGPSPAISSGFAGPTPSSSDHYNQQKLNNNPPQPRTTSLPHVINHLSSNALSVDRAPLFGSTLLFAANPLAPGSAVPPVERATPSLFFSYNAIGFRCSRWYYSAAARPIQWGKLEGLISGDLASGGDGSDHADDNQGDMDVDLEEQPEKPKKKRKHSQPVARDPPPNTRSKSKQGQDQIASDSPTKDQSELPRKTKKRKVKKLVAGPVDEAEEDFAEGGTEFVENISWVAVSDTFTTSSTRECEDLKEDYQDLDSHLDPTAVYPVASEEFTVVIPYYTFNHSEVNDDGTLKAIKHADGYRWRPFANTTSESDHLRKVIASQPLRKLGDINVPLHVHPDAQLFHSSGKTEDNGAPLKPDLVPSYIQSSIFVTTFEKWRTLHPSQHQDLFRDRGALIVHKDPPFAADGEKWQFDLDTFMAFTDPERLAWIHDLGSRPPNGVPPKRPGHPSDLLECAETRRNLRKAGNPNGDRQSLNLLSSPLEETTMPLPPGWRNIATHEFALRWLKSRTELPELPPPLQDLNWAIYATKDAITWHHHDVLFTLVSMVAGEKLWFVGRRRKLPPNNHRGNMFSRHAFDGFNGWTHMTDVWDFEIIHLDPCTTFYMPASTLHSVISITDCIGAGKHGIPVSNVAHCVLTTLHNVMLSNITTNADHEPARRLLLRIYCLSALTFFDPFNTHQLDREKRRSSGEELNASEEAEYQRRERARKAHGTAPSMAVHTPNLTSAQGIVDLLALRCLAILFLPLSSTAYHYMVDSDVQKNALPVDPKLFNEMKYAWTLAVEFDKNVELRYTMKARHGFGAPFTTFADAADECLCTMVASLIKYHGATNRRDEVREFRPRGFTPGAFKAQLLQSVARFDLHRQWNHFQDASMDSVPEPKFDADGPLKKSQMERFGLYSALIAKLDDADEDFSALLKWDRDTLPFALEET